MEPSTQRMLERARARRQKLDAQLMSVGQELPRKRNPLQENQSQFVKVTTEVEVILNPPGAPETVKEVKVSPTKVEVRGPDLLQNENVDPPKENDLNTTESTTTVSVGNAEKHVATSPVKNIRSQLKRLGALYSDSNVSSPIHRTEDKFALEREVKTNKPPARFARLAALADNIKQWEDDVSHPSCQQTEVTKRSEAKPFQPIPDSVTNRIINSTNSVAPVAVTKPLIKETPEYNTTHIPGINKNESKKVVWDKHILEKLENEENSSSEKHGDSVFKSEISESSSTKSFGVRQNQPERDYVAKPENEEKLQTPELQKSPEKSCSPSKFDKPANRGSPFRNQPGSSPKAGSVLHKASFFESGSPTKKITKDPTELSVSERLALFENKKGQALIPKAAFSMPVPPKYLEGKDSAGSKPFASKEKIPDPPSQNHGIGRELVQKTVQAFSSKGVVHKPSEQSGQDNSKSVSSHRTMFEKGVASHSENKLQEILSERERDIAMLRNRWNKNKNVSSAVVSNDKSKEYNIEMKVPKPEVVGPENVTQSSAPPLPPPLPVAGVCSPKNSVPQPFSSNLPQVTKVTLKMSPTKGYSPTRRAYEERSEKTTHTVTIQDTMISEESFKMKKIKVSPPKPGNLYPCLSDIEATTTEAESEVAEESDQYSMSSNEMEDSCTDAGDTSFGREILAAAGIQNQAMLSRQSEYMDSSESELSETAVLEDIDGFLDEALGDDSSSDSENPGPTPPKRSREHSLSPRKSESSTKPSPTSKPSQSFRYARGDSYTSSPKSPVKTHTSSPKSPVKTYTGSPKSPVKAYTGSPKSPVKPEHYLPMQVVDGDQEMPLMHSVSFYRRQQNMALKPTQVRQIVRQPEIAIKLQSEGSSVMKEEEAVRKKVAQLLDEVSKQQTVISQASQALNLCNATVEFSGSAEQVEGERLLLLATHKRHAALHEIQRLKVENSLKPLSGGGQSVVSMDKGCLIISRIALPLKRDYVGKLASEDMCHHFVCLVKSQEQVLITKVLAAIPQNLKEEFNLIWDLPLRLTDLYNDFKVTVEVYSIQSQKEMLPHNVKYHIGNKKESGKSWLTPKKLLKQDSRLVMPSINSPAGPSAVRSPEFRLAGYVVFSLKEVQRTCFTLNKVSYSSPLDGNIQLKMTSELCVDMHERGFLTMFEDVSGFGAWHRRWFVLKGTILAYWKYPDDEKKVPIGHIDLNSCTTEVVGLVSRDICARPNTFLLETKRTPLPDDKDSLVLIQHKNYTIIRNLLSADTKEERLVWCNQINKALSMVRAWGNKGKE